MKASWSATRKAIASITFVALATTGLAFAGSTAAKADGGPYTLRQTSFDGSNSINKQGDADGWAGNGWISTGSGFYQTKAGALTAGTTATVNYHVTDATGTPVVGQQIVVVLGKNYAGSTAHDSFANAAMVWGYNGEGQTAGYDSGGDQAAAPYYTDASGNISVQITNHDATSTFDQMTAFVSDFHVDVVDVVELHWSPAVVAPATYNKFTFSTGSVTNFASAYDNGVVAVATASRAHKVGGKSSGSFLTFTKGAAGYSGFDVIHTQADFTIGSWAAPRVSFKVYNAQASTRNVLVKLEQGAVGAIQAFVQAPSGWSTQTVDFSTVTGFNGNAHYSQLDLFPGFGYGSPNEGAEGDKFAFDDLVINKVVYTAPKAGPAFTLTPGSGKVTVDITGVSPSKTGGYDASSYDYSTDGGTTWTAAPATTFDITVAKGSRVTVKVRAVNNVGTSAKSTSHRSGKAL